jgi:UDP-glucose 4-epimerase
LKGNVTTPETQPDPNDFYGESKLQAEKGLHELECDTFKVAIIRPPMIYGSNSKGNFLRLGWLATKTPIFPAWHNKRSMLYVDNLGEFVKQAILRGLVGTFYPQNKELADTVEIVKFFAKKYNHKIWFSRLFNPFVWFGSFFLQPLNKMFASYYYDPEMSKMDFDYQLVSQDESFNGLEVTEANRHM